MGRKEPSLDQRLEAHGVSRRDFVRLCTMAAAAVGLPVSSINRIARAAEDSTRPSIVWLQFQECTGCTASLLRTTKPGLAELVLDLVSLDYHETLMAAAGAQAEDNLTTALQERAGRYVCVVEGAVPTKDGGIYCKIGGRTALELLEEVSSGAGAIIALGSCASFGGIPAAEPNPTGARGVKEVLTDKTVVSLPGCPANPYNLLGTVLQYVTFGTLPALDDKGRPRFAYARTIHEDCPRRAHFDAGRFAEQFGDERHRSGHCLYRLGCKGPQTHASCAVKHFNEVVGAWPIGVGHPCFGCTEQELAFRAPLHATVEIERPTPPDTYPPIEPQRRGISPLAAGVAGAIGGALISAGAMASKRLSKEDAARADKDESDEK